ncbi:hypothetical protein BGP_3012 [Beggiatoa sp. PS]|nr:hypothetical protein BGP_3012 [Beggiatoa sp. PS]
MNYQNRGDRWEGIAPNPVSGLDIELLSALVDYNEDWQPLPTACKLKFYLPKSVEVDLTVRELRSKHFYKMDRVLPKSRWQTGFNQYQWSTGDVIAALDLNIPKLGVVARLTKTASSAERVAPVVLYHSVMPKTVNGYLFAFKVGSGAKLKYAIYQGNSENPTATGDLGKQSVGEPFVVYWNSAKAKEGSYELIIDGHFLDNFLPIHQSVRFYHKASLK